MEDEKSAVEADDHQPELNLAELFREHVTGHFWEPVIKSRHHGEEGPSQQGVMEVGHHEIGIGQCPVNGDSGKGNTAQSADGELDNECDGEKHRGIESDRSAPHCSDPVEYLDSGRDCDQHAGKGKDVIDGKTHAGSEHMMRPYTKAEESDRHGGDRHEGVAEDRLARKNRNHLGYDSETGQDQDINLRVTEKPEIMLPEQGLAACRRIRKRGRSVVCPEKA